MTTAGIPPAPKLWNKNFTLWWAGTIQSALGSALAGIASAYLVLQITGSSSQMGVNLALSLMPSLLTPLLGAFADRLNVRTPLILLNLLRGVAQLTLGAAAWHGQVGIEILHFAAFFNGLIAACYTASSIGVTPRLVSSEDRPRATSLMQGGTQVAQLVGLVGGGALVGLAGSGLSLMLDGLAFLLFAALLWFVQIPARTRDTKATSVVMDLSVGLKYIRSSAALRLLPVQAFCINAALAPMEMLLPARMLTLGVGPSGFGLFMGLLMGGMASASLLFAVLGTKFRYRLASVVGFALSGLFFIALSLTNSAIQMYLVAFLCGAALATLNISLSLTFQTLVHPDFYGRVGSLLNTFGTIGAPLTLFALAPFADQVSLRAVFTAGGLMLLATAYLWATTLRHTKDTIVSPPTIYYSSCLPKQ